MKPACRERRRLAPYGFQNNIGPHKIILASITTFYQIYIENVERRNWY